MIDDIEFPCDTTTWKGGIVACDKPATYTLRDSSGTVFHLCKEHYKEVKAMFDDFKAENE
jgi:hypothetical protein